MTPRPAAVYADTVGAARSPATDAQFTIEPPPDAAIAGISYRMQDHVPVRSTAISPVPVLQTALCRVLAVIAVDAGRIECSIEASIALHRLAIRFP